MKKGFQGKYTALAMLLLFGSLCGMSACGGEKQPPASPPSSNGATEYVTVDQFTVDADLSDWTAEERANHVFIPVADGQSMYLFAKKTDTGVLLALDIKNHRYVTDSENPFSNSNFRFTLSDGEEERYITMAGKSKGVTAFYTSSESDGSIRSTVFELFVARNEIARFDDLRLGFRLHMSGYPEDYFWGYGSDWRADSCDVGKGAYTVTESGIVTASASEQDLAIDGEREEFWDGCQIVSSAYNEYGKISACGFLGADGAYFFFEATHREVNEHQYWCYNPNFEFKIGSSEMYRTYKAVRYSEELALFSSNIGEGAMKTTYLQAEKLYKTVCELFIPYENIPDAWENSRIAVGISFRSDEAEYIPWVPLSQNGSSTWDMKSLYLSDRGWEVA